MPEALLSFLFITLFALVFRVVGVHLVGVVVALRPVCRTIGVVLIRVVVELSLCVGVP